MSGGHWDYGVTWETTLQNTTNALRFLVAAEHELDWGICCDTCSQCAKLRVATGLIKLFDGDIVSALAVVRDRQQNCCASCEKRGY